MTRDELISAAIEARQLAYAPYSDFAVGAALLTTDGRLFVGCNVENASYGLAICAERTAICKAVSEGYRKFQTIVVAAVPPSGVTHVSPCGACRQFIVEFGTDIEVIAVNADDSSVTKSWKIGELIPDNFTFDQLD
ncbi:MAG: cytidine deaminase [Planctomycetota bacterium]